MRIKILAVGVLSLLVLQQVMLPVEQAMALSAVEDKYPILGPCSRDDKAYSTLDFIQKPFDDWPSTYHETVNDVLEEHFKTPDIECTADNYQSFLKPGPKLKLLASSLPPWKDPEDAAKLTQFDVGLVLVEYLRVYECSLMEYSFFQAPEIVRERFRTESPSTVVLNYFYMDLVKEMFKRTSIISNELRTARKTLYKMLDIIGSYDRLLPLQVELECLQRTSLDIRNVMSLTAEASSCLPRVWSAKDPLRDLEE